MNSPSNENEAMEVARKVLGRLIACRLAGLDEDRVDAELARVIATALDARDAELRSQAMKHMTMIGEFEDLLSERDARIAELVKAMRHIKPYLEWTVSDESPGHHPTMPSAVGAFLDTLARAILTKGDTHD